MAENGLAIHSGVKISTFVSFSIVKLAKKIEPLILAQTQAIVYSWCSLPFSFNVPFIPQSFSQRCFSVSSFLVSVIFKKIYF